MKKENHLYELIQALSPNEKRYFKLYAKVLAGDGYKKEYEKLFDALNNWDGVYDEAAFKQKHRGKTFLKNFAAQKQYLHEMILNSCSRFVRDENIMAKFLEELHEIEFLHSKKLKEQFAHKLNIAEKFIKGHDNLIWQLLVLYRKQDIYPFQTSEEIEELHQEKNKLISDLLEFERASYLSQKILFYTNRQLGDYSMKKINAIYDEATKWIQKEHIPYRVWSKLAISIQVFLGHLKSPDAIDFSLKVIEKMETKYADIPNKELSYSSILVNTLRIITNSSRNEKLFYELLEKLRNLEFVVNNHYHEARLFLFSYARELNFLISQKQFDKSKKIMQKFHAEFDKHKKYVANEEYVGILGIFAEIELTGKNHKQVQTFINDATKLLEKNKNMVVEFQFRFINFLNAAMSNNYDALENIIQGLTRFGKRYELEDDFFKASLQFCKAIVKNGTHKHDEVNAANILLQTIPHQQTNLKYIIQNWIDA